MTDLPPVVLRYNSQVTDPWVIRVWPRQLAEMWVSAYGKLEDLEQLPHYLRVMDLTTGNSLGVLRREDITGDAPEEFRVSSDCNLKPRPDDGKQVRVAVANDQDYDAWRHEVAAPQKKLFWGAVILTVVAATIQLAFDIGKIHTIVYVGETGQIVWAIAKYLLLAIGVFSIQQYAAYKKL